MRRKCFFFIVVLFCGFGANRLHAQGYLGPPEWQEVGTLGALQHAVYPNTYTAFYFFDAVHGVTATTEPTIYYISDPSQGAWNFATVPAGFTTVRMFRFIQGKLYAATDGPDVLVSNDSGKTWSYSGLNLGNANDIYADASGKIHALTDPMKSFARIDTMHCVAVGGGSLFVSSDGGLNWTTSVTGIDPLSLGAFADPCKHVFICPGTYGTNSLRSTDYGQTWQDVLTGASPYPEYIEGASTTCYVNDTGGMFRSIDDGLTWTSIITVNYGPHFPMFVWGSMGEHVVMSYWFIVIINHIPVTFIEPWMTTAGGDDNLHSALAMTDSNGALLGQDDTMNVPFRVVSRCNSFSIPIALEADVPGLSVKATLTNNSGGDVSILSADSIYYSEPILNQHYVEDTMWLAYDPHHLVDTALITFENHWNCSDWTETRSVIITSLPTAIIAPPPVFAGSCQPVNEAAHVTLDSCSTLIIDSLVIPSDISSRLNFSNSLPDTLSLITNDSLLFTFNPADTIATILASVQVFGHYYPSAGLDSTLNFFNFNVAWTGMDSDFSNFGQSIPVKLVASPTLPWGIYPSGPDSAAPGADVTCKIIQTGTLPSDVTTIEFTLTHNDDLLGFIRADEPSVDTIDYTRTPDGLAHLTFRVNPIGSDSVIATLHFYPYVARDTQTAIALGNAPSLLTSSGTAEQCLDSITTGQTTFTLMPVCGSDELSTYLRNGTILIDNITPNPASGTIVVGISSGVTGAGAELSIIDALGRTVCHEAVVLSGAGKNYFPFDIEGLPNGMYGVQLRGVGICLTHEFVKE